MNALYFPIDFILHVDQYLGSFIQSYGSLTYLLLFLIIFAETGLVITPFLPGDSLIFMAGTFAAAGFFNVLFLFILLVLAAILGDTVNYWIGNYFGVKIFSKNILFRPEYLERTKEFYAKYGGKTVFIARFVPIIRTFAPFVAGVGKMDYRRFLIFNISGAVIWVGFFVFTGYFFGQIPFVQKNLNIIVYLIILLSISPIIIEYLRHRKH